MTVERNLKEDGGRLANNFISDPRGRARFCKPVASGDRSREIVGAENAPSWRTYQRDIADLGDVLFLSTVRPFLD